MQQRLSLKVLVLLLIAIILWFAFKPNPEAMLGWDKIDHVAAFFVLAAFGRVAWSDTNRVALFLVLVGFGGAIEILQGMTGRDAQWGDWMADILAAAAGIGAGEMLLRLAAMVQPPRPQA